jgi:soluble lytic murein transglycosylase-like protein
MGPSIKYWKKVAQCETAGDWKDGGNWGGGLGIARSTWQGYGGHQFASHPAKATILQQIVVANRIAVLGYQTNEFLTLDDRLNNTPFFRPAVGFNGWGCIKNNAYLKPKNNTVLKARLPVGEQFYCPQYEKTFKKYALPAKVFSYIAWRESRCNPGAVNAIWENGKIVWTLNSNGSYDSGLLQINSSWFKTLREQFGYQPEDLMNPAVNALFASWILHFSSGRLLNWNIKAKV